MSSKHLRVLIVEDSADDVALLLRELHRGGYEVHHRRVDSAGALSDALKTETWDIVVSDHNMPNFNALNALKILQDLNLDLPFVILSGSIGEEVAVAAMKAGAHDFVMKGNLLRLLPVVARELRDAAGRAEYRNAHNIIARNEQRMAEAQRIAAVGSWELDMQTRALEWSDEHYRLMGLERGTFQPSYETFLARVLPADRDRVSESIRVAVEDGNMLDVRFWIQRPDGTKRMFHGRANVVRNPDGAPQKIVGTVQDITEEELAGVEKRKLEEQLLQAQKMEAIGQLAGGIAHDFNNFLSVVMGYSELVSAAIGNDPANAPVIADVHEIKSAAERAATLTRQLLAFSRRQVLQPAIIDLNDSVDGMDKMVRRLIGEHIQFEIIHQKGLGSIKADPGQIEQVILNLVLNARDAMPLGGRLVLETKNVEITTTNPSLPPMGAYILVTAKDSGTGMTPQVMERVFEPFFTTKEKGKGTGLGLSMVYGVVKQSGGYIYVESQLGEGTTFSIYFPRVEDLPVVVPQAVSLGASPESGSETILLAEDDDAIRTMVSRFLRKNKYSVLVAANGEEAMSVAERHGPDIHLMITDIVMPGISGIQLAEKLQARRKTMKVLFISGYTDHAVFKDEVPALSAKYLTKPFSPTDLLAKVKEILGRPLF